MKRIVLDQGLPATAATILRIEGWALLVKVLDFKPTRYGTAGKLKACLTDGVY